MMPDSFYREDDDLHQGGRTMDESKYEVQMRANRRWIEGGPRYLTYAEALEGRRRLETMSGRTIRCRIIEVK